MATGTPPSTEHQPFALPIPPLQHGEVLTREEFHRRYEAMPELKKAELIDGVVYMPSPVTFRDHGNPQFNLIAFAGMYVVNTPGVLGADNTSLLLDERCEPQPDVALFISPAHGSRFRMEGAYVVTAPEWIGEVSASSASYDLHAKMEVYRRHGVREYVVWRVLDRAIDWFVLRADQYERLPLSEDGSYRSDVFPGLWLDPRALIAGNAVAVMQTLQRGLASPEHQDFVEHLALRHTESQQER